MWFNSVNSSVYSIQALLFDGLPPGPSPALGTVSSCNILFLAIFRYPLLELVLTFRSPSVVRVSLRFCELMGSVHFR